MFQSNNYVLNYVLMAESNLSKYLLNRVGRGGDSCQGGVVLPVIEGLVAPVDA